MVRVVGSIPSPTSSTHGVPLTLTTGSDMERAYRRGKRLNDMELLGLLKDLEIAAVLHGFRSSFRDWATEDSVFRRLLL